MTRVVDAVEAAATEPWVVIAGWAAVMIVAAVTAPILVVAVPLAVLVDRRGWRRWPIVTGGVVGAAVVAASTDPGVYGHVVVAVVASGHQSALRVADVAAAVALAVTSGVAVAPILALLVHHRDEHEQTRHGRAASDRRRAERGADRIVRRGRWPTPSGQTVLGVTLTAAPGRPAPRCLTVPVEVWRRQALIVGETGSGKTVTALTIAGEAMRAGWDVYWVDGKADGAVADQFLDLAARHGRRARDATGDPIDGWRGGPDSIVNRLLATQVFTEPYYEGIARNVVRWAVGSVPPCSFGELVERMDRVALRRAWRDDPRVADAIRRMPEAEFLGTRYRYEGVAWAVGSTLDGDWSYEDAEAAYVPVGRPEHRHQAQEVGAFLLEDLLHWAMARKDPRRHALAVIDEFSRIAGRADAAVDLVERVRTFGVGVVLIGQTWASLGPSETVRERLAGTVGTIIVHQLKAPERLAVLGGTEPHLERTEHTQSGVPTGRASQRAARRFVVDPDAVRRLGRGEAFLLWDGTATKMRVRAASPSARPPSQRG